jgi:protein XagA
MKGRLRGVIALGVVVLMRTSVATAGPWTPAKGHGQLIVTTSVYETTAPFDAEGRRQPYDSDGMFRKVEMNPYLEVGVTDRLALVLSAFASQQRFTNRFVDSSSAGLGDTSLRLRYRLTDSTPVLFAITGGIKLPTGQRSGSVRVSDGQRDLEVGAAAGGSLSQAARPPFWQLEANFRQRAGAPADELKLDASIGGYVHPRVMLVGQTTLTRGLRNADEPRAELNPTLSADYDLYRVQGSTVLSVTRVTRFQAGVYAHIGGRNTGGGGGVLASVWFTF